MPHDHGQPTTVLCLTLIQRAKRACGHSTDMADDSKDEIMGGFMGCSFKMSIDPAAALSC